MGGPGSGGSNRKSTAQHRLEGTYRASRHGLRAVNAGARPAREDEALAPPEGLRPSALELWRRFVTAYPSRFAGDLPALVALEAFVRASDRHHQAREAIDRDGILLKGARGGRRPHPALRVEHVAASDMLRALQSLKLGREEPTPVAEDDPFDEFEGLSVLEQIQGRTRQLRGRGQ